MEVIRNRNEKGFSLLEALLTLGIFMVIVALSSFTFIHMERYNYTQYAGELKIKVRESQIKTYETGVSHKIKTYSDRIDFFMEATEPWYTFYMPPNVKIVIDSYRNNISGVAFKPNKNISSISYLRIETPIGIEQYTLNIGRAKFTNARKKK
jgi:competence protein ComGC